MLRDEVEALLGPGALVLARTSAAAASSERRAGPEARRIVGRRRLRSAARRAAEADRRARRLSRATPPRSGRRAACGRSSTRSGARSTRSSRPGRRRWWRATRTGPTRSTTCRRSSPTGPSCTATAASRDDPALVCGFALYKDRPVCVVGHQKGRDTKQKIYRNFGMPKPEGYRKALRVMQLAAKFGRPDPDLRGHAGRLSRARRRGARPGRGHRLQPARDGRPAHADHRDRHRRGRQRRRPRHRGGRPREHARALRLLGDLARGLRLDPLARRLAGRGGGHRDEDHRPRPAGGWVSWTR